MVPSSAGGWLLKWPRCKRHNFAAITLVALSCFSSPAYPDIRSELAGKWALDQDSCDAEWDTYNLKGKTVTVDVVYGKVSQDVQAYHIEQDFPNKLMLSAKNAPRSIVILEDRDHLTLYTAQDNKPSAPSSYIRCK